MTVLNACFRCVHSGGVAILATTLAIGLVIAPPPAHDQLTTERHLIRLETVTLSALVNSSVPTPAALNYTQSPAAPSANATTVNLTPQNAIALVVGLAVGAVAAVPWYLTFPVTLPLMYFGLSFVTRILGAQPLDLGTALQVFLAIPFVLGAQLVGDPQIFSNSAAAAVPAASARRVLAESLSAVGLPVGADTRTRVQAPISDSASHSTKRTSSPSTRLQKSAAATKPRRKSAH